MIRLIISPAGMKIKSFELMMGAEESAKTLVSEIILSCREENIKLLFKGKTISLDKTLLELGILDGSKIIVMKDTSFKPVQEKMPSEKPESFIQVTKTESKESNLSESGISPENSKNSAENSKNSAENSKKPKEYTETFLCSEECVSGLFS